MSDLIQDLKVAGGLRSPTKGKRPTVGPSPDGSHTR
jgi:hypothetical protein